MQIPLIDFYRFHAHTAILPNYLTTGDFKNRENADCLIRFSAGLEAFVVRDEARPFIPLYYNMSLVLPTPRNQGIRVSDRGKKKRI